MQLDSLPWRSKTLLARIRTALKLQTSPGTTTMAGTTTTTTDQPNLQMVKQLLVLLLQIQLHPYLLPRELVIEVLRQRWLSR